MIDKERILNVSPEEFNCTIEVGGIQGRYEVRGINLAEFVREGADLLALYAKQVPDDAEWVIKFEQNPEGVSTHSDDYVVRGLYCASGLALIPKE